MSEFAIAVFAFGVLFVSLTMGVKVGLSLALSGMAGIALIDGWPAVMPVLSSRLFNAVASFTLVVVPLFVLMGYFINHADVSQALFSAVDRFTRRLRLPGGIGLTSIAACAAFGAVTGSSVGGVVTIGPIAIKEMRRFGYSREFASGLIAASGTLGILIPPSIALVLYGFVARVSIERLLIAGLLPGLFSALVYVGVTVSLALFADRELHGRIGSLVNPLLRRFSAADSDGAESEGGKESDGYPAGYTTRIAAQFIALFLAVFGVIYLGIFTVTESAALGAIGAFVLLIWHNREGRLRGICDSTIAAVSETTSVTSMLFLLFMGAGIFGHYLVLSGITSGFASWATSLTYPAWLVVTIILFGLVFLGMFLDGISILLIMVPLTAPIVIGEFGYDPLWFGVMFVKTVEIGLITPPLGMNGYIVSGLSADLPPEAVFRGVVPFLFADVVTVALLFVFPDIVTWLPHQMLST